jgi:transposase
MSISERKHVSEAEAPARRIEIFTGAGRRRSWTAQEKAAIVAESFERGVRVCQVARRHGLTPQQLFAWRREARRQAGDGSLPPFVPAIVDTLDAGARSAERVESETAAARPPTIELEIDGASVWIWRGADPTMAAAIVGALKGRK